LISPLKCNQVATILFFLNNNFSEGEKKTIEIEGYLLLGKIPKPIITLLFFLPLAAAFQQWRKFQEADKICVKIREKLKTSKFLEIKPLTVQFGVQYADLLLEMKRFEEARDVMQDTIDLAIEITPQVTKSYYNQLAFILFNVATQYEEEGKEKEAKEAFSKSVASYRTFLETDEILGSETQILKDTNEMIGFYLTFAHALVKTEELEEAKEVYKSLYQEGEWVYSFFQCTFFLKYCFSVLNRGLFHSNRLGYRILYNLISIAEKQGKGEEAEKLREIAKKASQRQTGYLGSYFWDIHKEPIAIFFLYY